MFEQWTYDDSGNLFRPNGKVCSHTGLTQGGYRQLTLTIKGNRTVHYQHRVLFFLYNGYWASSVDHIDRDTTNNRKDNLRDATASEQEHNKPLRVTNSSGFTGVRYRPERRKWESRIMVNKGMATKLHVTKISAILQRLQWEHEHGIFRP